MYTLIDHLGQPAGLPASFPPEGSEEDWRELVMPKPRTSQNQVLVWSMVDGRCVGNWSGDPDPTLRMATKEEINLKHRELEISPLMVLGELFDCDEKSEIRMRDAIAYWDLRPIEPGVFENRIVHGVTQKVIIWTLGDNSLIELTKAALSSIYNEMLVQRALRAAILFAKLRDFKNSPATIKHISENSNWLG